MRVLTPLEFWEVSLLSMSAAWLRPLGSLVEVRDRAITTANCGLWLAVNTYIVMYVPTPWSYISWVLVVLLGLVVIAAGVPLIFNVLMYTLYLMSITPTLLWYAVRGNSGKN
jgi:hypothetical protein